MEGWRDRGMEGGGMERWRGGVMEDWGMEGLRDKGWRNVIVWKGSPLP